MAALPRLTMLVFLLLATPAAQAAVLLSTDPDGSAVFQVRTSLQVPPAGPELPSLGPKDSSSSSQPSLSNSPTSPSNPQSFSSSPQFPSNGKVPFPPLPQSPPQFQPQSPSQFQPQPQPSKEPPTQPLSTSHRVQDQNVKQRFFGNNNLFQSGPSAVDKVVKTFDTLQGVRGYQGNFAPVIQSAGFQGSPSVSGSGGASSPPSSAGVYGNGKPEVIPFRREEVVFQTANSNQVTPSPRVVQVSDGLSKSGQFQKAENGQRSLGDRLSEAASQSGTISPPVQRSNANSGSFSNAASQQNSKSHSFSIPAAGQASQPGSLPHPGIPLSAYPPPSSAISGQVAPFSGTARSFGYVQPGAIPPAAAGQTVRSDAGGSYSDGGAVGGKGSYTGPRAYSLPVSPNSGPSSGVTLLSSPQKPQFQGYGFPVSGPNFQPGLFGPTSGNASQAAEENFPGQTGNTDGENAGYSGGQGFVPSYQLPTQSGASSGFDNGQQNAPPGKKLFGLGQGEETGGFPSYHMDGSFPIAAKTFDFSKDPLDQMNENFPRYPIFDDFVGRNGPPSPSSSETKEDTNTPTFQGSVGPRALAGSDNAAGQPPLPFPTNNRATTDISGSQESGAPAGNVLPGFQQSGQHPFPSNIPNFQFPQSNLPTLNELPTYGSNEQRFLPADKGGQSSSSVNDANEGEGGDVKGYDTGPYQAIGSTVQGFQDRANIALPLGFSSSSFQFAQPSLSSGSSTSPDGGSSADGGLSSKGFQTAAFQPFSQDSAQVNGFQPFSFSFNQDSGGASVPAGGFQPIRFPSDFGRVFGVQPGFSSNPFSSGQEKGVPAALTLGGSDTGFYGNGGVEVAPSPSQTPERPGVQGNSQAGSPGASGGAPQAGEKSGLQDKGQPEKAATFPDGNFGFQYGGQGLDPSVADSLLPQGGSFPFSLGNRKIGSSAQGFSGGSLLPDGLGNTETGFGGKGDILSGNNMEEMGMVLPLNVIVPALLANRGRPMFPTVAFPYAVNSPGDAQLGTASVGYASTKAPGDVSAGKAGGDPCLSMDYDYDQGAEEKGGGAWQGTVGPVAFKGGQAHLDGRGMLYMPALALQPQGFNPGYTMRFTVFPMGDPEEQAIISNSLDPTRVGMAVSVKDNQISLHIVPEGVGSKPTVLKQTFVGPTRVEIRHNQDGVLLQVGDRQQKNQTGLPRAAGEPLYVGYGASPSGMLEPYRGTFDSFHFDMCPRKGGEKN